VEFLEKSQTKDHDFSESLTKREAERELKSQKLLLDAMKDIAKIKKKKGTIKNENSGLTDILYIMYRDKFCLLLLSLLLNMKGVIY